MDDNQEVFLHGLVMGLGQNIKVGEIFGHVVLIRSGELEHLLNNFTT